MGVFQTLNQLMMTSAITQWEPSTQNYSILWRKQICMSSLDMSYRQLYNAPENKLQDQ